MAQLPPITVTTDPLNISALLDPGCYLAQSPGSSGCSYGAFPATSPPADRAGMFYAEPHSFFRVNVGAAYDPVFVVFDPLYADAGNGALSISEFP